MTGRTDDWYEIKKRYLVKETIGSGGFGKVKRAIHIATSETVAIKVSFTSGFSLPVCYIFGF